MLTYLFNRSDTVHASNLSPHTHDLETNARALLDLVPCAIREVRGCSVAIEFEIARHTLGLRMSESGRAGYIVKHTALETKPGIGPIST